MANERDTSPMSFRLDKGGDSAQEAIARHVDNAMARREYVRAGEVVFRRGDPRDVAYIIDQGTIHIKDDGHHDDAEQVLAELSAGEIFGEMGLVEDGERTAMAVAADDTTLFVLSRRHIRERVDAMDPLVGLMINLLVERYRASRVDLPESVKVETGDNELEHLRAFEGEQNDTPLGSAFIHQKVALEELKVEQDVRAAIENKEFEAHLQPIINLRTEKLYGFEALIRWRHPERGLVPPNVFIPVAERTGVVQLLDLLMLEQACKLTQHINATRPEDEAVVISVNLSGMNFENTGLVQDIINIVEEQRANPAHIKLEVTESAFIGAPDRAEKILRQLQDKGFSIALDDFGTGYSSLSYLHKFSLNSLKIDRSFIQQMHDVDKGLDIVRAIVSLAHTFKLGVVAEGIEYDDDIVALNGIGCEMGQGFYIAKPMPGREAVQFASDWMGLTG
jgi:EAL domain-containing protein (putative c-di-GMP-specific phosphodiesterase class I)